MEPQERLLFSLGPHGFHRIVYTQWGDAHNKRVVICAHGLTRNGRDFDFLATELAKSWRVACPDLAGRGHSDWLICREDYNLPLYLADMAALIARLGVDKVDWIGTSLGGLIGIVLAAQINSPIRKLVLNDIGPYISKRVLKHIAGYIGADPRFKSLAEAEIYLHKIHFSSGPLNDAQWAHVVQYSTRQDEKGRYALHYDPSINDFLTKHADEDIDLWSLWERVSCPVLVLRGVKSGVLASKTAQRMLTDNSDTELIEIPKVGHAPTLMDSAQIKAINNWLKK